MLRIRVIPVLLIQDGGLVKGEKFKKHQYVGDPINAVRIFNEKEVDELVFLDISATYQKRPPDYGLIQDMASEAFMPIAYGGGITSVSQVEKLFKVGVEKVVINSQFFNDPDFIKDCSRIAGSQSIVVSMDVKKSLFGSYEVYTNNATIKSNMSPVDYAKKAESMGAGELILTSVDREGTGRGYDLDLIRDVARAVNIPVIANGGAGSIKDLRDAAVLANASGVAGGFFFTFHGKHKAVLLTYPGYEDLEKTFSARGSND